MSRLAVAPDWTVRGAQTLGSLFSLSLWERLRARTAWCWAVFRFQDLCVPPVVSGRPVAGRRRRTLRVRAQTRRGRRPSGLTPYEFRGAAAPGGAVSGLRLDSAFRKRVRPPRSARRRHDREKARASVRALPTARRDPRNLDGGWRAIPTRILAVHCGPNCVPAAGRIDLGATPVPSFGWPWAPTGVPGPGFAAETGLLDGVWVSR